MKRAVKAMAALACACMCACAPEPASAHSDVLSMAGRYLGGNPTGWRHNWCAEFLNRFVLAPLGLRTGTPTAASFLRFPRTDPHPGAIVVLSWHGYRADHVGIVKRVTARGLEIRSGNYGHRVADGIVRPWNVMAFVDPGRSAAASIPWPIRHHRHKRRHHRHHRRH